MRYGWLILGFLGCNGEKGDEDTDPGDTDVATDTDGGVNSCPPGDFAAACAGTLEGTFEGDLSGPISGFLDGNGFAAITFETSQGNVASSGCALEDGTFNAGEQGIEVTGTYDYATCTGLGTWLDNIMEIDGTWQISTVGM
ncbi:MAG: hypothetical protein H0V89_02480 [Deltaproteobacteria bacterium]|nr:hypothetical protein [Deltaproteobacteria bacterium]